VSRQNGEFVIDLHDVRKIYRGRVHALCGVEMQVCPGEVFGLLGPNGAGKSTLVKIMMTVVRPTAISGTLLGKPVGHKPTLARVGYLPEHHRIPRYMTGRQVLDFYGALCGVQRSDRRRRTAELLETVGMTEWANKKLDSYSKGMQQRIGLGQSLMNDPDLIVLDEPTDGVDPIGRRDIRDVLIRLRNEGKTVFLNSHLLSELEMICDRVAILVQGRVAQQGRMDDLTAESRRYEIRVRGSAPGWIGAREDVRAEPAGSGETKIVVRAIEPEAVQPILDRLRGDGAIIVAVAPVRETLEDLFMRAITDPETGQILQPGAAPAGKRGAAS
jgi:ABC-2 type transport system ATP-binding protein